MLKIINAKYGSKDVTEIINNSIIDNKLYIRVDNGIFGDPNPGVVKTLIVDFNQNNILKHAEIIEGGFLKLPETNSKRLGIFYTNNNIDNTILKKSLELIYIASKKHNVDILTCAWMPIPNNPFIELISPIKNGNLFNINYQILMLLLTANKMYDYKYVSFLEHDVLYGEDYFTYPDFDGNIISNNNYIGFKNGFQPNKHKSHQPLHETTMNFKFAIKHFSNILANNIIDMALLEPQGEEQPYKEWSSPQSSIHVFHGKHITSHYSIYSDNVYNDDIYWGNYKNLLAK